MAWLRRAVVVTLMASAGCGGDEQPAAQATATPAAECAQLIALRSSVAAALSGHAGDTAAPQAQLDELARTAPDAIRPDIATIADAYGKLVTALDGLDSAEAIERLQKTVGAMDQQALVSANANVTAWVTAHC